MRISAKADYAVRATIELAAAGEGATVKGERLADAQQIPLHFLENILGDLKQAGIVATRRGPEGGYRLARSPAEVSVADVIRAVEGPLASVRGDGPECLEYTGSAESLPSALGLTGAVRSGRTHTIWPGSSSSSVARARVSCTHMRRSEASV